MPRVCSSELDVECASELEIVVYASIPTSNDLCNQPGVSCASDATSLQRGSFGFASGQYVCTQLHANLVLITYRWNRITLLIRLNDPQNANGNIQV